MAGEVKLTLPQRFVLTLVAERGLDLRKIRESTRQRAIDLAMMEPPLVDVDSDRLFITPAGRAALKSGEG